MFPTLPNDSLLQALLQDARHGLILYQIVRNETHEPIDFRYQVVNPVAATLLGSCQNDLVGRSCKQVFPQGDELRTYYQQVAITGQNLRVDYQLLPDGRWFEVFITGQAQQTLLCFFTDITDRVLAEQELIKNLTLLQQTEELANIGSWDYDRTADRFFWSEGMYRLFGLESGTAVSLQTYVDCATEPDQPVACCLITQFQQATKPFEAVLQIRRQADVRCIKVKGVVRPDAQAQLTWVLGICWDISSTVGLREQT
jgi:PAS domain-containing protein